MKNKTLFNIGVWGLVVFSVVCLSGCGKVEQGDSSGKDEGTKLKNGEEVVVSGIKIKFLGVTMTKNGLPGQDEFLITCPLQLSWRDQSDTLHLKEGEMMNDFGLNLTVKKCDGEVDKNSYATVLVEDTVDPKLRANPDYCQFSFDCSYLKCNTESGVKPGQYPICKNNSCICGCGDITNNFTCE